MIIGLGVDSCISLFWMGVLFLYYLLPFFVFWPECPRLLVTGRSSCPVGCLICSVWGFECLHPSYSLIIPTVMDHKEYARVAMEELVTERIMRWVG